MARLLALDWDRHEARFVLGTTSAGKVHVQAVEAVPLVDVAEGGSGPQPDLSGSLAAALADQEVGRISALVGVERSSIDLLHFTLPPAKESELPELVAHQAMRESQLIGDQSVVDFVPMGDDPTVSRSVIAAVLSPGELERIEKTCTAAGLKPSRMLLRPFAAASLFVRTASPEEDAYLLVNRITDEVDLTIVVDRKPVFFRTVRLPEGASEAQLTGRLLTEINRTLAAAPPPYLDGDTVECVYLFGRGDDHQELIEQIRDDLFLPAKVFDPFEALRVEEELVPEDSGRFAPLLGMLLDEAAGSHAVDFLHPRKKPQAVNRARIAMIAGGVLLAAILGLAYERWSTWSDIHAKYLEYAQKLDQLEELTDKADDLKKLVDSIQAWKAREVVWLDELRDLSLRLPSARDVVLSRMSMTQSQSGGGVIDFEGLMRGPEVLVNLEQRIRDDYRQVRSKRVQERRVEKDYTWTFDTSLSVKARSLNAQGGGGEPDRYVSHLRLDEHLLHTPAEKPPDEKAETLGEVSAASAVPQAEKASP